MNWRPENFKRLTDELVKMKCPECSLESTVNLDWQGFRSNDLYCLRCKAHGLAVKVQRNREAMVVE